MGRAVSHKRKKFNTTGLCIPQYHYMADVSDKVNRIKEEYFASLQNFAEGLNISFL